MKKVNTGVIRKNINDCWCTAISKALNIDYDIVYKDFEPFLADNKGAHIDVISAYLKNKGLDNIANLFYKQYKEELEHSEIILNLLLDLNANFIVPSIDEVGLEIDGFLDIANFYLEREIHTTTSLNEIKSFIQ